MFPVSSRSLALGVVSRVLSRTPARAATGQKRFLNVHEYISMDLMKQYGVSLPQGRVATTAAAAEAIATEMLHGRQGGGKADVVIKAQVLAGGRGLGTFSNGFHGGVHIVTRSQQAFDVASKMLGHHLITKQTGAEGRICDKVYVVERLYLRREMYVSIMLDRAAAGPVLIASSRGGTSIEDVAATTPELIFQMPIDLRTGITPEQVDRVVEALHLSERASAEGRATINALWRMFAATDATMIEVNPLAETPDGRVVVADAKINFDDNAAFRQPDIFKHRDFSQEDAREVEASRWDLNYIGLDGNIGCMVNGAGLAMATMDIIKLHGGAPANFLDVGGGATADQVTHAFEILNGDSRVQTILVNIFGGIMRCDVIAQGVVQAARKIGLRKPVVLRLQGTNVKEAKAFLEQSGYRIILVDDLDQAALTAVKIAGIVKQAEEVSLSEWWSGGGGAWGPFDVVRTLFSVADVTFELPL